MCKHSLNAWIVLLYCYWTDCVWWLSPPSLILTLTTASHVSYTPNSRVNMSEHECTHENLITVTNMLERWDVRLSVCGYLRDHLHPNPVSEGKQSLSQMDRGFLQGRDQSSEY